MINTCLKKTTELPIVGWVLDKLIMADFGHVIILDVES